MNNPVKLPERAYFITLCSYQSRPLLGRLANGQVNLTESGRIASQCWSSIPEHMPEVQLDAFIVMPNHFHNIIIIHDHVPEKSIQLANDKVPVQNSKFEIRNY